MLVVGGLTDTIPWSDGERPTMTHHIVRWPHSLMPSLSPIPFWSSLWIGEVQSDGAIKPIPAAAG